MLNDTIAIMAREIKDLSMKAEYVDQRVNHKDWEHTIDPQTMMATVKHPQHDELSEAVNKLTSLRLTAHNDGGFFNGPKRKVIEDQIEKVRQLSHQVLGYDPLEDEQ